MFKKFSFLLIPIFIFSVLYGCNNSKSEDIPVEKNGFAMDTVINLQVYGKNAQKAADDALDKIQQLDSLMTIDKPGGDMNKLNGMAGKGSVKLSSESIYVLETAKKFSVLSNGTFDITVGPLVKAWAITSDNPKIPSQDEIDSLLKLVNMNDLSVDTKNNTAMLKNTGQTVDLGGIAKGYAGDTVADIFRKYNIRSGLANLGGNVIAVGSKPNGSPWNIGIQNPRGDTGEYVGFIKVSDKAVVTSGDYQRYFEKGGKRYHHILDPHTGYPADSGLISTTIITDKSIDADALNKVAFVSGLEKGMKIIEGLKGVEAIFITTDKKIYITPGLKNSFVFEDISNEYEFVQNW